MKFAPRSDITHQSPPLCVTLHRNAKKKTTKQIVLIAETYIFKFLSDSNLAFEIQGLPSSYCQAVNSAPQPGSSASTEVVASPFRAAWFRLQCCASGRIIRFPSSPVNLSLQQSCPSTFQVHYVNYRAPVKQG